MIQKRSSLRLVKGRVRTLNFYLKDAATGAPLDITSWVDFVLTMKRLDTDDDPEFVKVAAQTSRYAFAYAAGQAWNAHLDCDQGDDAVHDEDDTTNDIALALPTIDAEYIAYINALYDALVAHAANTGGDYHVDPETQDETTPTAQAATAPPTITDATTVAEADVNLSQMLAWYNNVHRDDETHMFDDVTNGYWTIVGGEVVDAKAGHVRFVVYTWDTSTLLAGGHVYDLYATNDDGSTVSVQDPSIAELVQGIG